ncbi:hypothetical protein DSO57_1025182 [Entomophthora muscae]|uniref:Uncharacterized protein n=1 Tax=Entomophthora muscae TaxID=34485 RepID=A0ACC2TD99_9FUNG|nr:hypothetical protein DSO57_1025182 [Entomophthora muscae]
MALNLQYQGKASASTNFSLLGLNIHPPAGHVPTPTEQPESSTIFKAKAIPALVCALCPDIFGSFLNRPLLRKRLHPTCEDRDQCRSDLKGGIPVQGHCIDE